MSKLEAPESQDQDCNKQRITATNMTVGSLLKRLLDVFPRNTEAEPLHVTEVPPAGGTIQHINGTVATAGTPDTITPTSGNIKSIIVQNPFKGPNENGANNVLLISIDGGAVYYSVAKGGQFNANPVDLASFDIDTNTDGTNYEIVLEFA